MLIQATAVVSFLVFWGPQAAASGSMTLVRNGQPVSTIITADHPTAAAQEGAEALQLWLKKSSGAVVPIKKDSEIPKDPKDMKEGLVLVGDTERTRLLGIDPDEFDLEEILVRTFPQVLVLVGDDERPDGYPLKGTLLAVDAFAERVLGVRLLWPGEWGEIVPHRSTIRVSDVTIRDKPRLRRRDIFNLGFNGATHTKLDALGWDREKYRSFQEKSHLWFRFQRPGGSYHGSFGHAFGDYWDRFHEAHPEWFALQPDGTRDNSQPAHAGYPSHRLCVSNPQLIAQVAQDCIATLQADPTLDGASVSPNDGGLQTFCLCDRCEAWDAPEGPIVYMRSKKGRLPHVSLTDRFVRFYSQVAERVTQVLPDRDIGAYAYSLYTAAPIHAQLHPHVVIGFVSGMKMYLNETARQEMRENWRKWSETAQKLFLYSNSLRALHALPTVYVHRLGEDLRFYADNHILFAQYDCVFHHWATNGLNYYVLAKLLWNPYREVDEIVDEYCDAGFGPAAGPIRRYFEELERLTTAMASENRTPSADTIARYYTDETLARLQGMLDEAERMAGDDHPVVARVAFLRQGLEYAPICRDYLVAKAAAERGDKWQRRRYLEEAVRRVTWFQKLGPSRAIHAPWLIYWDW